MKTNLTRSCLSAILLVGITALVTSQDAEERAIQRLPMMRQAKKNVLIQSMLSTWTDDNTGSTAHALLFSQDGNGEALGISKEQSQKLTDYHSTHDDPHIQRVLADMDRLRTETPDLFTKNASPQVQKKYVDLSMELQEARQQKLNNLVKETLTPDQIRKIKEYQIATMSEGNAVSPGMFEVLGLSGDQKKQLEEIRRELRPELEKDIEKRVENEIFTFEKIQDEIGDQLDGITDPEESNRIRFEAVKRAHEKYPEIVSETNVRLDFAAVLANKLKFRMFDVLTDEQMERMAQLIDNPPDHVKKIFELRRKAQRKLMGLADTQDEGEWTPGPDSWKPGDGIPEGYMKYREEQRRFPRRK